MSDKTKHLRYNFGSIIVSSQTYSTALWIAFWMYILQAGEPDLLSVAVAFLSRF